MALIDRAADNATVQHGSWTDEECGFARCLVRVCARDRVYRA